MAVIPIGPAALLTVVNQRVPAKGQCRPGAVARSRQLCGIV